MKTLRTPEGAGVSHPQSYGGNVSPSKLSLFSGATSTEPAGTLTLAAVVERIRTCPDLARKTARVRELQGNARKEAKKELQAVTFGGAFSYRANDKLTAYSGLLVLDFDDVPDAPGLREAVGSHPCCLLAFVSPSGNGVKAVVRLDTSGLDTSDGDAVQAFHRRAFNALQADCEARYGVALDEKGKDVSRLCFLCSDPEALTNAAPDAFPVPAPPPAPPRTAPALVPSAVRRGAGLSLPTGGADATRAMAGLTRLCKWVAETGTDITVRRNDWVNIGWALAREVRLGLAEPFARQAFHALSANYPQYCPHKCDQTFSDALARDAGNRTGTDVTLGTVFHLAKERGYVPANRTATDGTVDDANDDRVIRVKSRVSEALDELERELVPGASLLLQAPTGTGKTYAVLNKKDGLAVRVVRQGTFRRVWVLVPYRNLAKQIARKYGVPGVYGGVGGVDVRDALEADVLVTTYDGLAKLGGVPAGTLLVVDESHELTDALGYRPKALELVTAAADAATQTDGAYLCVTATPGEHFADAFGLSVLRIVPEHVNRKAVTIYRSGSWKRRKRACLALLAAKALAAPDGLFVLFCNSKRALKQARAFLKKTGLPSDAVFRLTSNDDGPAVDALVQDERFPPGVRVVLATKALGAGYNVDNENVGGVFLLPNGNEGLRPNDAAQYTARFREMGKAGTPPLLVHVFAGEPSPNARDANRGMAELLGRELWKADKAKEARRGFDLAKVDDRLPSVRLDRNAQAIERTTDPDKGVVLQTNVHHAYFLASERRNRARTPDDFVAHWGQYDPGAAFDVRQADDVDGETAALLQTIEDEHRQAEIEARETVAAWTVSHAMAVTHACYPRLRTDVRRYDPNAKDTAKDVSAADRERFLLAGGTTAAKRFLSRKLTKPDGTVPALRSFPAPQLWTRCVLDGNAAKFAKWETSVAVALQMERQAGRLGDVLLYDGLKAADFLLWERYGLPVLTNLVKTQGDGVNMKGVCESVRAELKKRGFDPSDYLFRQVLVPLYFHIGPTVRLTNDDGTRTRVRRLERLQTAQTAERFAAAFGLERGEYERFVERLKEDRQSAAKAAKAKETADNEAQAIAAAESVTIETERLPVPMLAARLGADNAIAAVTFADDPPDDEPCPF